MKDMIPQIIEHYPRGKGSFRLRVTDSNFQKGGTLHRYFPKKFSIPKLDFLLDQSIKAWDEEAGRWKQKTEIPLGEVNILAALMHKYMMGFMMMQAGTRLFYGLTNFQDPMIQLGYQIFE